MPRYRQLLCPANLQVERFKFLALWPRVSRDTDADLGFRIEVRAWGQISSQDCTLNLKPETLKPSGIWHPVLGVGREQHFSPAWTYGNPNEILNRAKNPKP